jgi:hypothetical protein
MNRLCCAQAVLERKKAEALPYVFKDYQLESAMPLLFVADFTWHALANFLSFRERRKLVGESGSGRWNTAVAGRAADIGKRRKNKLAKKAAQAPGI